MEKLYRTKPAPKSSWSKSPFDSTTATGGSHTGELNLEEMDWFTKDWSPMAEYLGEAQKPSFLKRLFGAKTTYVRNPIPPTYKDKEFGSAGNLHGAMWKFGYHAVMVGEAGEKLSEEMLTSLLVIPGTRIFHGVKFPGSEKADIDHVIVNGDKVVFVDTKNWKSGDYWWENPSTVRRYSGGKIMDFEIRMPFVLEHYARVFKGYQTRGVLLVHKTNDKRQLFRNTYPAGRGYKNTPTPLTTAREFFEEIGEWLADGADGRINEEILNKIMADLKPAPKKGHDEPKPVDEENTLPVESEPETPEQETPAVEPEPVVAPEDSSELAATQLQRQRDRALLSEAADPAAQVLRRRKDRR